jgi:hypothetical protein
MTAGQAAKALLEDRDALTHFAIMVMRNNRLKDGKRIGYQPAIEAALQRLIDEDVTL